MILSIPFILINQITTHYCLQNEHIPCTHVHIYDSVVYVDTHQVRFHIPCFVEISR